MSRRLRLYSLAVTALLPAFGGHLLLRAMRQPAYRSHWPERLGFCLPRADHPVTWLHAVSVGETRAAEPLVRALLARGEHVLLTHTTPTGRATGRQLFGDAVLQCYLPWDTPGAVRRFLHHFRIVRGLLMETELWFNLIDACRRRQIPLFLVNARLSAKSAAGYGRLAGLTRDALRGLSGIAAQTAADAQRLEHLGAPSVAVLGNIKFDVPPPADLEARGRQLRDWVGPARPVLLLASTREGEEEHLLAAIGHINVPDLLVALVPRHPQRFDAVGRLIDRAGLTWQRRSDAAPIRPETRVVLGDSMGEMFAWYAAADIAFIGGSLLPLGGQNLMEACTVGCPVLVGPHTFNFAAATEAAVAAGAARRVADAADLAHAAAGLLADPTARQVMGSAGQAFCAQHRGACARTLDWLDAHAPGQ